MGYVPAEAHFGDLTYVELQAVDPATGLLRKKRYKLNRIKGAVERKAHARDLVAELNFKLRQGWSPWSKEEAPRAMHSLREVIATYVDHRERTAKGRSLHNYITRARVFKEWAATEGLLDRPVMNIERRHLQKFLDHVLDVRKVNPVTYNGYKRYTTAMFGWMVERDYRTTNPGDGLRRMRTEEKFRTLITPEERKACLEWFAKHDPPMVIVCLFVFHVLLRPRSELTRIRVENVDLENGVVNVEGTRSKSKRIRRPAIPKVMMPYLIDAPFTRCAPSDFIIGRGMRPGPIPTGYNVMGDRWNKMRAALGWGKDKVLYSLRDSGIVQLIADGVELHLVMRQADHREIATTNRYVQHYFPNGIQQVQDRASAF